MQILITGCTGYVGGMISRFFSRMHEVFGTSDNCMPDRTHFLCDLRQFEDVASLTKQIQPDVIIHAAGTKDIAFCERNPQAAMAINGQTTFNLARTFGDRSRIIYISTDYVFDGQQGNNSELDKPAPATHYGQSKLAGEHEGLATAPENFIIVRTAALYDSRATFLKFLSSRLSVGETVDCFSDIFYTPTYYSDFLATIDKILQGLGGEKIYHACGQPTSRYEFAQWYAKAFHYNPQLIKPCYYRTGKQKRLFLFPDLSLNGSATQDSLSIRIHSHEKALFELARRR